MATTPIYRPDDLAPDASEVGHTHPHTHTRRQQTMVGALLGALAANPQHIGRVRNHIGKDLLVEEIHYEVRTAPAGTAITVQLRQNGVLLHTGTIPVGQTLVSYSGLALLWQGGAALEAIPTQVGAVVPGADLTVNVVWSVTE